MKTFFATAALFVCIGQNAFAEAPAKPAAAAPAAAPAAGGSIKTENCGAMIASIIPLPTKMAELMTVVSDNMNGHAAWVGASKDKAAKAEATTMKKLAKDHHDLAALFKKTASDMEAGSKIAPAPHDMSKMDAKAGEAMMKQVALEREMAAMMTKHADETEKMLKDMAKGAP